jgi:hypothetical protein
MMESEKLGTVARLSLLAAVCRAPCARMIRAIGPYAAHINRLAGVCLLRRMFLDRFYSSAGPVPA